MSVFVSIFFVTFASSIYAQSPYPYTSPRAGATLVSAMTTIGIRNGERVEEMSVTPALFSIEGAATGVHDGEAILADDGLTVIFKPNSHFVPSEIVTVTIEPGLEIESGVISTTLTYTFTVSPKPIDNLSSTRKVISASSTNTGYDTEYSRGFDTNNIIAKESIDQTFIISDVIVFDPANYHTIPDTVPTITVTVPVSNTPELMPGEGYVFLSNIRPIPHPFLLALDNNGEPIFYRRMVGSSSYRDFKPQATGQLTYYDPVQKIYSAMDDTYQIIHSYEAGNGYEIDSHGLQVNEKGHVLLQIYDTQPLDMSKFAPGGNTNANVIGAIIQELDPTGNVIFEWRSWDHMDILEAIDELDLTTREVDVTHINSVEWDVDGNILASIRRTDSIIKISRETSDIIWRLGGKLNDFTFTDNNDVFSYPHDARRITNGHITMYDNGNYRDPQYSRSIEYEVDELNMIITKTWEYRNQPDDIYSRARGSSQRLPNGNTIIGWGGGNAGIRPTFTEVTSDGIKVNEMYLEGNQSSYRVLRAPWVGHPAELPILVISSVIPQVQLHYGWNGATEITDYQIYGGTTLATMTMLATEERTGIETTTILQPSEEPCYFYRILPQDQEGNGSIFSNPVFGGRNDDCVLLYSETPLADGGFEDGLANTAWEVAHVNATDVICDNTCNDEGITRSYTGSNWAEFSNNSTEESSISLFQSISLTESQILSATVTFYFRIDDVGDTDGSKFTVELGEHELFVATGADSETYTNYTELTFDISPQLALTDTLRFDAMLSPGSTTSFIVDDVILSVQGAFEPPNNDIFMPLLITDFQRKRE